MSAAQLNASLLNGRGACQANVLSLPIQKYWIEAAL